MGRGGARMRGGGDGGVGGVGGGGGGEGGGGGGEGDVSDGQEGVRPARLGEVAWRLHRAAAEIAGDVCWRGAAGSTRRGAGGGGGSGGEGRGLAGARAACEALPANAPWRTACTCKGGSGGGGGDGRRGGGGGGDGGGMQRACPRRGAARGATRRSGAPSRARARVWRGGRLGPGDWWLKVKSPHLWGGLRRAPEATARFRAARAALWGECERPEPSDGPGRQMGRCPQTVWTAFSTSCGARAPPPTPARRARSPAAEGGRCRRDRARSGELDERTGGMAAAVQRREVCPRRGVGGRKL